MSISAKRLQFLDKENKVFVKDFTKEVTGNAIYTNFVAPILTELGLGSMLEGAKALNAVIDNYSNLYEKLSSPTEAAKMVSTMLAGLDLADPRLADVAGMLTYIKNDQTGAKAEFVLQALANTTDSFINNPSLINKYSSVSSNAQTQMLLSALAASGSTAPKTDFNKDVAITGQSPAVQTTRPSTDNNSGNPFLNSTAPSPTPSPVPSPISVAPAQTPAVSAASSARDQADRLRLNVTVFNETVATRVKRPEYENPLLKPLEDTSSNTAATDWEFGRIAKFFLIYAAFKIATYRALAFNLYTSRKLFEDITVNVTVPVPEITATLVERLVNVNTDSVYGRRKLLEVLGGCAELLVNLMKGTTSTEESINQWYTWYTEIIEGVLELGLKDTPEYKAIDSYYSNVMFAAANSTVMELSADMVNRVKTANSVEMIRFGAVFESTIDTIVSGKPTDIMVLDEVNDNFIGVHASTYLFFKIARSVNVIDPSATFNYKEKIRHLGMVLVASWKTTDFRAKPLTSQPTKDLLDKLPMFLNTFKNSAIFNRNPTTDQLKPYEGFDFLGMWKLLKAKSKRMRDAGEYDNIINATPEQLLAQYDGSTTNETILKVYNLFEQEADYANLNDLNIVKRLVQYMDRENGVRPIYWVGRSPENFDF